MCSSDLFLQTPLLLSSFLRVMSPLSVLLIVLYKEVSFSSRFRSPLTRMSSCYSGRAKYQRYATSPSARVRGRWRTHHVRGAGRRGKHRHVEEGRSRAAQPSGTHRRREPSYGRQTLWRAAWRRWVTSSMSGSNLTAAVGLQPEPIPYFGLQRKKNSCEPICRLIVPLCATIIFPTLL